MKKHASSTSHSAKRLIDKVQELEGRKQIEATKGGLVLAFILSYVFWSTYSAVSDWSAPWLVTVAVTAFIGLCMYLWSACYESYMRAQCDLDDIMNESEDGFEAPAGCSEEVDQV